MSQLARFLSAILIALTTVTIYAPAQAADSPATRWLPPLELG